MNVLITGGAGFIGSRLAMRLAAQRWVVTVLDNLSPQVHTARPEQSETFRTLRPEVRFIRGDVTCREDFASALDDQEIVVHLAAETGTGQSMYEIERYSRVNVGGTALLLDLLANSKHAVRRVVVASSRAVYGEGKYWCEGLGEVYPKPRSAADMRRGDFEIKYPDCSGALRAMATDEESRLHPSSVYGITKLAQEQLVMTACSALGIEAVAFRYQNVYGPGQSLTNPYTGMLSIFSNLIMSRQGINIFEDGTESRDFVHVDDVIEATLLGITTPQAAGQVFNVGSGKPVSVAKVAESLSRHLKLEVPMTVSGNFRVGDIRHNFACLKKIESILGFSTHVEFDDGIAGFCDWVRSVGQVRSNFELSLAELREKGLLK